MGLFSDIFGRSTKQKTRNVPRWAMPLFREDLFPLARTLAQSYAPEGTPVSQAGETALLSTVRGDFLRPESNPYLAGVAEAIQRGAEEAFNRSMQNIRQRAQLETGTTMGTAVARALGEQARRSAADVADRLASLYGGEYGRERAFQLQAIPAALAQADKRLLDALRIAQVLQGLVSVTNASVTPPIWGVAKDVAGTLAGVLSGAGFGGFPGG